MNKEKYKQLLALRKSEEEMFWHLIRITDAKPRDLIGGLRMNNKRAWYILRKWVKQKRYEYGTSLDLGWLTLNSFEDYDSRNWLKVSKIEYAGKMPKKQRE